MKIMTLLALTALAAGLAASPEARAADEDFRTVRDLQNRFTIDVPASWGVALSRGDPAVSAVGPPHNGELSASLTVIVHDLPAPITPQTCVRQAALVMRYAIKHYTSLGIGAEQVGPLPAYSHAYVWTSKAGEERRSVQVCVTVARRAFVEIGTTTNRPARVRDDWPVLIRIIHTLRPSAGPPDSGIPNGQEQK